MIKVESFTTHRSGQDFTGARGVVTNVGSCSINQRAYVCYGCSSMSTISLNPMTRASGCARRRRGMIDDAPQIMASGMFSMCPLVSSMSFSSPRITVTCSVGREQFKSAWFGRVLSLSLFDTILYTAIVRSYRLARLKPRKFSQFWSGGRIRLLMFSGGLPRYSTPCSGSLSENFATCSSILSGGSMN